MEDEKCVSLIRYLEVREELTRYIEVLEQRAVSFDQEAQRCKEADWDLSHLHLVSAAAQARFVVQDLQTMLAHW